MIIVAVEGKNTVAERNDALHPESIELSGKTEKERKTMSSKNNNQINIPQAREAMDRFKMQAAQEVGVNLQNGYNGHLTSREAGSVGGQMVKKMCPVQTVNYVRNNRISAGHVQSVQYIAALSI